MSNRPNFRKLKVSLPKETMDHLLGTDAGQQIAQAVEELKAWCERVGLDFDEVTDLWQAYAKTTPNMSVVESIRHFKTVLMERFNNLVGPGKSVTPEAQDSVLKLLLPGDKDFRI